MPPAATSGIAVAVEPKSGRRKKEEEGGSKGGRITTYLGDTTLFKLRALAEKAGVPPEDLVEKSVDWLLELPSEKQMEFAKKASFPLV